MMPNDPNMTIKIYNPSRLREFLLQEISANGLGCDYLFKIIA
jgi:hypothetical protein